MTDYVKSTNFASKDSLATGNPLKIVKGTEIDTEFNNIATAVTSKADLNSPTFIGNPAAPSATLSDSLTRLATVATVQALYPVGSIYLNATNSTNPSTLLGFGTWVSFGAGRVPVGFDGSDTLFNAAEKTGGSKDVTVVAHTHTFSGTTSTNGDHSHTVQKDLGYNTGDGHLGNSVSGGTYGYPTSTAGAHNHTFSGTTDTTGSSGTNANVQPYITVYMWKRTA